MFCLLLIINLSVFIILFIILVKEYSRSNCILFKVFMKYSSSNQSVNGLYTSSVNCLHILVRSIPSYICPVLQICVLLENASKQGSLQAVKYVKKACGTSHHHCPFSKCK